MILILTFKEYEQSTDPVVDWLLYYKAPFIKIFLEDLLTSSFKYRIDINEKEIYVNGKGIIDSISVVFFRRFEKTINFRSDIDLGQINRKVNMETNGELKDLHDYLFYILSEKIWFPHYSKTSVNKLEILNEAKKAGLSIPHSIVTNSKEELKKFISVVSEAVYKPIRKISYYTVGRHTYSPYTTVIDDEKTDSLNEYFFPSLFQTKIPARYEIRCFYLEGELYASAILAENREGAADIKLSFNSRSTKWVTYLIPDDVAETIRVFMDSIGLNTGSIDILKGVDGKYYFIEVNPVGQYFSPSVRCNYYIEKKIAEWLIKINTNEYGKLRVAL